MGGLKKIRARIVGLVEHAKERERARLTQEEFDERFSDDLEKEFDEDPSAFAERYEEYLASLTPDEWALMRSDPI